MGKTTVRNVWCSYNEPKFPELKTNTTGQNFLVLVRTARVRVNVRKVKIKASRNQGAEDDHLDLLDI